MNKTTEALKLAEEALEELHYSSGTVKAVTLYKHALAAIREALAEPLGTHEQRTAEQFLEQAQNHFAKRQAEPVKQELNWGASKFMPHEQPVKQEPVAYTNKEQVNELIKESARLIGSIKDEGDQYLTAIDALRNAYRIGLKDSPVDAKAIRAEAFEEAEEIAKTIGGSFAEEFLAAISGLR